MLCEDFDFFLDYLVHLKSYSEMYIDIFSHKEAVETLKNIAVRSYNYFYGKRHPEYKGNVQRAYWNVHPELVEYLFLLDSVLKAFDEKEKEEKKRQVALAENEQNVPKLIEPISELDLLLNDVIEREMKRQAALAENVHLRPIAIPPREDV
ncbi:MAG: hypothetical protein K2G25_08045, partial [Oscillospiraceae bacterium]|nr:hypothetical protein [Oscillospiraceae bacterium]